MDAYTFIKQPIIINGEPWGIQFTASKVKDWINMASFVGFLRLTNQIYHLAQLDH